MFRSFFLSREWALWAWGGMAIIIGGTWYQVQVDVQINEWFGEFYDGVQKALGEPGSMTIEEFYTLLLSFGRIAEHLHCRRRDAQLLHQALGVPLAPRDETTSTWTAGSACGT